METVEALNSRLNDVKDGKLITVKKALCFGAGNGRRETEIFKKLTPNLEKAVFVDLQKECCEEMLKNVPTYLGDKVEYKVEECDMLQWDNGGEKFDLILTLHSMYGLIDENKRRAFLKKCFDQWLEPEGKLFLVHVDDSVPDHYSLFNLIYNNFGLESLLSLDEIKKDLTILGKTFRPYPFKFIKDLNHIDDAMIEFIRIYCPVPKLKSEIKLELEKIQKKSPIVNGVTTIFLIDNN